MRREDTRLVAVVTAVPDGTGPAPLPAPGGVGEVSGDDRVELGVQQLGVGADDIDERRGRGGARWFARADAHGGGGLECGVIGHGRCPPRSIAGRGWGTWLRFERFRR